MLIMEGSIQEKVSQGTKAHGYHTPITKGKEVHTTYRQCISCNTTCTLHKVMVVKWALFVVWYPSMFMSRKQQLQWVSNSFRAQQKKKTFQSEVILVFYDSFKASAISELVGPHDCTFPPQCRSMYFYVPLPRSQNGYQKSRHWPHAEAYWLSVQVVGRFVYDPRVGAVQGNYSNQAQLPHFINECQIGGLDTIEHISR